MLEGCSPFGEVSVVEIKNPNINWATTNYDYGNLNVGSNLSAPFTLQNTGDASVSGCGAVVLSDSTNFSIVSNTCTSSSMASGEQCQVEIASHPTTPGVKSLEITRQCADNIVVQSAAAQIVSNGVEPILNWSPLTHDFGNVTLTTNSATQAFTFANSGTAEATGCSNAFITDTTNFSIVADTCSSAPLSVSNNCLVSVEAHPTTLGLKTATLIRVCTFGGVISTTANQIISTGVGTPSLAWSPLTHSFGNINVGANSSSQTFTLTNSGPVDASGCSAPTISDTTHFTILSDSCSTSSLTANGGTCNISVRANPASTGLKSATVSRTCSVGGTVSTTSNQITVTGTMPSLAWSPLTHGFGNVNVGDNSSSQTFTLSNSGDGPATGCSAPTLSNTTDFSIVSDGCSTSNVTASGSCNISVRANPASTGLKSTTVSRTCSTGGTVTTTTNQITATGTTPVLAWSPLAKAFGNVEIGFNSSAQTFTLVNTGTGPATGCTAPTISNATDFAITVDNCSTNNLSNSSSCTIDVVAKPETWGAKTATISRSCTIGGVVSTTSNQITTTGVVFVDWQQESNLSNLGIIRSAGGVSNDFNYYFRNPSALTLTGCTAPVLSNTTDFTIISDSCGTGTLAPKITCEVKVRANPLTTGSKTTNLTRTCTEPGSPTVIAISNDGDDSTAIPIDISAGAYHTCAAFSNGTVKCWGFNAYGALAHPSIYNSTLPRLIPGISNAVSVAAGIYGSCATLADGTVKCWGHNGYGQLGNGTQVNSNTPVTVSGITNAIKVAAGGYFNCALLSGGSINCWGANDAGQLGNGTTTQSLVPVEVLGISTATQIYLSTADHACARLSDGTAKCWGSNWYGKLGDGTNTARSTPVFVSGISNATQVAVGEGHSCALLNDNTIKCWGYGWMGNGGINHTWTPIAAAGITNAIKIIAGQHHTCALLNDNTMKCWGPNSSGQVGDDTTVTRLTPVSVTSITNVTQMTGYNQTCVILSNNSVKCWGRGDYGQLGDGLNQVKSTPVIVPTIANAIKVANMSDSSCALLNDGTIKCWGRNSYGQLGDGTGLSSTTPVLVSGISNATQIASSGYHACALLSNGTIKCWGINNYGQLGDGTGASYQYSPVLVSGISTATQIFGGSSHTCALLSDQTIKCWGNNYDGQLGDGTSFNFRNVPVAVVGLSGVTAIGAGSDNSCAILTDTTVRCWGRNYIGQLGNGTSTNSLTPVTVTGLTGAVQLATGDASNCARLNTGSVKCWGQNGSGQLGNGTVSQSLVPVNVNSLLNATEIVGGANHYCALLTDNTMKCWGGNSYSQIGDASGVNRTSPVYSLNISSILTLGPSSASSSHQCGVKNDNTVFCVGANGGGQTGFSEQFKRTVSGL